MTQAESITHAPGADPDFDAAALLGALADLPGFERVMAEGRLIGELRRSIDERRAALHQTEALLAAVEWMLAAP